MEREGIDGKVDWQGMREDNIRNVKETNPNNFK